MDETEQDKEVPWYSKRCTDKCTRERVLARGCIILIDYMDPTSIVDLMQQEEFLKFSDCRDIKELPLTTEKNRAIITKINRRGEEGYTNFKRFLTLTKQTILVDYLESIEKGKDTTAIIETLQKGRGIANRWKGVKDEIIALYQDYYVKTELSPLTPGSEIHVDDLYVPLQMEEANTSKHTPQFPKGRFEIDIKKKQIKEVKCYRDMLYDEYQLVNTVFVIADPGVGKTTFCRKLTSVWCKAHTGTYGCRHHADRRTEPNSERKHMNHDNTDFFKESEDEEKNSKESEDEGKVEKIRRKSKDNEEEGVFIKERRAEEEVHEMRKKNQDDEKYIISKEGEEEEKYEINNDEEEEDEINKERKKEEEDVMSEERENGEKEDETSKEKEEEEEENGISKEREDEEEDVIRKETESEEDECKVSKYEDGCNENDSNDNVEEENIETMKLFDFLFFVSLRHTSDESKIEDMITNQLKVERGVLQSILSSKEIKCLIILDGLDEWSAPLGTTYSPYEIKGFPKIDNLSKCHILVTTRPWKLLSLSQIGTCRHKEINIIEMKIDKSKRLIRLFLNQIRNDAPPNESEQLSRIFLSELEEKDLSELSASPLVLKLLLCLWLESGKLKTSICKIYGAVIDLLIERGLNRNKEDIDFSSKIDQIVLKTKPLASCFHHSDFDNLNRFSDILVQLAKLSYDTIFSGKENSKLIFRDRDLKRYDLDLELSSKLGILSQRPVIGKSLLYRERTVAFLHKSFQEFYAALYISYKPEDCINHIRVICNSADKILEVSNVFQFVGGIGPKVITHLFDHIRYIDTKLDTSHSGTEHTREMFSKIMLSSVTESLNCCNETLLIKMNYLSLSENKFLKCLDYVCPKELKGINLSCVDLNHSQVRHLLTCSPNLRAVNLLSVTFNADSSCDCMSASSCINTTNDESLVEILTVGGELNIYPHMQRYRSLQELYIYGCCNLMHVQIAYLLSDSALLRVVSMTNASCKADQHCGCLNHERSVSCSISVFSRICRCLINEQEQISPVSVISYVETLNITHGEGMLKHIYQYPRIQEITLLTIQLTHTEMCRLLTDSRNLEKIKLTDITCTADETCGCLQCRRIHASSIHSISYMKACDIVVGCDLFKHIHKYARLQDIRIVSINLDHLEITTLLTTSPCLNKVKLRNVTCKAVQKCGCLTTGFQKSNRNDRDDNNLLPYLVDANCSVSVVKTCTLVEVSGVFNHIRVFSDLYELDIGVTDLTHTEVTSLLTTSSNLRIVRLDEVNCKADRECGCPTGTYYRTCCAETCTIEGGSEMFAHIDNYPKLKNLKLHYLQLTHQKLTSIISKSPNLQEVSLAGLEYVTNVKHDSVHTDYENLKLIRLMRNQILYILRQWPHKEGLFVKLEDIELFPEMVDTLAREVQLLEKFEILEFTELTDIKSGGDSPFRFERPQRFTLKLKVKEFET